MLKEELICVKEKWHKINNSNNYFTCKKESLKKEIEILQEAIKKLWVIQIALETTTEAINYE